MQQIRDKIQSNGISFIQQYYITTGLKVCKERRNEAALKELEMMLKRNCFVPIHVKDMTHGQRQKAADAMLLRAAEKHDTTVT